MAAYTKQFNDLTSAVTTSCAVCPAVEIRPDMVAPKVYRTENALWDTGATCCLISQVIIDALNLQPIDKAIISEATTSDTVDVYLVHVGLPNGQIAMNVEALCTSNSDYDFVLGMDIICECDMAITHPNQQTKFTFERPSKRDIDFTKN